MSAEIESFSSLPIAGYDTPEPVCPGCLPGFLGKLHLELPAESLLNALAAQRGIDREDLRSYDTTELPKPVFGDQVFDGEICTQCGCEL